MNEFKLPFSIEYSEKNDFIIAKCYETKQECYKLTIPKGKQLGKSIRIKFRGFHTPLSLSLGIELQEGSKATIIEDWDDDFKAPEITFVNHITCQANSNLNYIVLNGSSSGIKMTEKRASDIADNAKCHIYTFCFGSTKFRSQLTQKTSGKGAEINTDIIAKSTTNHDLSFNCRHEFTETKGTGIIMMKGIAQDTASLHFDGMINIKHTGGGSAGYLKQETLNLSPDTTVRAIPGLQIDTNDVKAGHSAAIHNLNEEDLYYFQARGIKKEMAKKLLITGFLAKELKKIEPFKAVYDMVKKLV